MSTDGIVVSVGTDGACSGTTSSRTHTRLAIGSSLAPAETSGIPEEGHVSSSESGSLALREELLSFTEGHLVFTVIATPYVCPAVALEAMFMADDWLGKRGPREDIQLSSSVNRLHGNPTGAEWARPVTDEREIDPEAFSRWAGRPRRAGGLADGRQCR